MTDFFETKIKNSQLKKTEFFKIDNSQNDFLKISWIGPCQGHWCSSTYMVKRLSNVSSRKCCFCVFKLFLPLRWTASKPWTNQLNFHKKKMRIGDFKKLILFLLAILEFLLHPHENQSKLLGYQEWDKILMITLV